MQWCGWRSSSNGRCTSNKHTAVGALSFFELLDVEFSRVTSENDRRKMLCAMALFLRQQRRFTTKIMHNGKENSLKEPGMLNSSVFEHNFSRKWRLFIVGNTAHMNKSHETNDTRIKASDHNNTVPSSEDSSE